MVIYNEMQKIASDILGEFSQGNVNYLKLIPGSGPIDNPGPSVPQRTKVSATVRGVSYKYVKDGLALSSDLTVTMAVRSDIVPDMRDFIEIDGTRYKIVQDISTPGAGTRVVWKFIVGKR